jgi:hypothetical protein
MNPDHLIWVRDPAGLREAVAPFDLGARWARGSDVPETAARVLAAVPSAMLSLRVITALVLAASCGERPPPASSSVQLAPAATPGLAPAATPAPAVDAAGVSADASVADAALAAVPDAAVTVDYRVRLSGPSRVVTVPRDASCAGPQASCRTDACFVPLPSVDRPAAKPAMVACERDRDCTVVHTICCEPDSVDVRTVRADHAVEVPAFVCGRGHACGAPDPGLIASFNVGCVEHTCRMLQPLPAEWCEDRDTRYRVVLRGGTVLARDRTFDCYGHAPSCRIDYDCYREVERRPPRPAPALRRCTRDAECALAPVECCDCGARDFRAIRLDAIDTWRGQRCGPQPVACPACVGTVPADLAPACLQGSCEVVEGRPSAACSRP